MFLSKNPDKPPFERSHNAANQFVLNNEGFVAVRVLIGSSLLPHSDVSLSFLLSFSNRRFNPRVTVTWEKPSIIIHGQNRFYWSPFRRRVHRSHSSTTKTRKLNLTGAFRGLTFPRSSLSTAPRLSDCFLPRPTLLTPCSLSSSFSLSPTSCHESHSTKCLAVVSGMYSPRVARSPLKQPWQHCSDNPARNGDDALVTSYELDEAESVDRTRSTRRICLSSNSKPDRYGWLSCLIVVVVIVSSPFEHLNLNGVQILIGQC